MKIEKRTIKKFNQEMEAKLAEALGKDLDGFEWIEYVKILIKEVENSNIAQSAKDKLLIILKTHMGMEFSKKSSSDQLKVIIDIMGLKNEAEPEEEKPFQDEKEN